MFQSWVTKFQCAFRGIWIGISEHSSFRAHLAASLMVLLFAVWLRCTGWQWTVLGLCIGMVWSLELFNSSIEHLARGLCSEHNAEVGKSLDTASAAVLFMSVTAAIIGLSILGWQFFHQYWGTE